MDAKRPRIPLTLSHGSAVSENGRVLVSMLTLISTFALATNKFIWLKKPLYLITQYVNQPKAIFMLYSSVAILPEKLGYLAVG